MSPAAQRNEPLPPAGGGGFCPAHIHGGGGTASEDSVESWLRAFRTLSVFTYTTYTDIICMETEQGRSWLDTLKNSQEVLTGNCELDDFEACDAEEARVMMKNGLHKSMAYSVVLVDEETAGAWAQSFIESFSETTQWYSNREQGGSWSPVTEATFDFCLVAVDSVSNAIGYLLVTDED